MIKLIGTDGNRFYNFTLERKKYIVGRNQDADIAISHKTVSRNHAIIEYSESKKAFTLWNEAITKLEPVFIKKGIVKGAIV